MKTQCRKELPQNDPRACTLSKTINTFNQEMNVCAPFPPCCVRNMSRSVNAKKGRCSTNMPTAINKGWQVTDPFPPCSYMCLPLRNLNASAELSCLSASALAPETGSERTSNAGQERAIYCRQQVPERPHNPEACEPVAPDPAPSCVEPTPNEDSGRPEWRDQDSRQRVKPKQAVLVDPGCTCTCS